MSNTNLACIDTSGNFFSITLKINNKIYTKVDKTNNINSKQLLPLLQELCIEANIELKDIDAMAYINGPGSFTGLRIGFSVVQAMAFVLNIKVIEISPHEVLAQLAYRKKGLSEVLVITDAR